MRRPDEEEGGRSGRLFFAVRVEVDTIRHWRGYLESRSSSRNEVFVEEMDQVMGRLQRAGMKNCAPKLNPESDPSKWLSTEHAPWKKLDNERPKGETVAYDKLLAAWKEGKVR